MVVRRGKPTSTARKPAPRTATKANTSTARKPPAKKAAPVKKAPDVTVYADKEPTGYHKAFARWIVREVGYNPSEAANAKAAFLMGVSIATAARPAFQNSDFLTEWRETTGEVKRGPKPQAARSTAKTRKVETPVDDEFDDEDDDFEDEEVDEDEDDEFDDESEEDDDEFDDEDEDSEEDDDDFEDEEEEPEPPKRAARRAPAKKAPAKLATRRAPAKRAAKAADDEDLF